MTRLDTRVALVTAALLTASCAPAPAERAPVPGRLPDGVSVSITQSRADVAVRGLRIGVSNESGSDILVTDAEFESSQFDATAVWARDSTVIAAGRTVALPVALPDPICDDEPPSARVRLTLIAGGGEPITAEVVPVDELDRLPELRAEECFAQIIRSVVDLRAETLPRVVTVAGRSAVEVDLTAGPAGAGAKGTVSIESVSGTTLLAILDRATNTVVPVLPLAVDVPDAGAAPVTVTFVPNRCDPHAVAEDKQGTLIPLAVGTPAGLSGEYRVAASPVVEAALLDFVADACGFG